MAPKQRAPIRFRALEKVRVRPPSLVQVCLQRVAENFLSFDNLHTKLGRKQLEDVYAMLDIEIPLPEAAVRINDENYWKRRTQAKHRNVQVERHGMSWKQTYLELELQQALERVPITVEQDNPELQALREQVQASRCHIFQLHITQLPSHLDLSFIFDSLPALCSVSITYGNRRLGMDYERAMFGMKISDAQYLARNVRVSQTLVSLSLPCNMIDDELVKVLMGGLSYGHMLTQLDLSHNKIGDRGARRLASLLDPDYCLQSLDLSDNQIHANGCMHLGAHLAENVTCETVNLRLNRCEDNGVSHLFQDLCVNKHLRTLNLSCNDLTVRCLPYLNAMLGENTTLTDLDLSANPLYQAEGEEGGHSDSQMAGTSLLQDSTALLVDSTALPGENAPDGADEDLLAGILVGGHHAVFARCLVKSTSILRIDLRSCGFPADLEGRMHMAVKRRELRAKDIPIEAYERVKTKEEEAEQVDEGVEQIEGEGGEAAENLEAEGAAAEGEKAEKAEEEEVAEES